MALLIKIYLLIFSVIIAFLGPVKGWDTEELEIFDLVEEINNNFYTVLNISQDAELKDIKKAFRSLSLVLHPDKNSAPDAEIQFRQLVSIYDVLKDTNKRNHYNNVLKNGLPNWKSAVYYYRHVRKLGLLETFITLFIVLSIGQYLVAWGSYFEKKYTAEQIYEAKFRKANRKRNAQQIEDFEKLLSIPKPSFMNTLPIQIPKLVWFLTINFLPFCTALYQNFKENYQKKEIEESSEEEESEKVNKVRRRKKFVPVERSDNELPPRLVHISPSSEPNSTPAPISGGLWTDDDLAELCHLVKKYPGGTPERWEKIAETMFRTVSEVTYMANKLKDNNYRLPGQEPEPEPLEVPKKQKTRGGKTPQEGGPTSWSQLQQKALETALAKYPKGPTDRWEKISKCVPDKTKEECMIRYKYLVELVKKQKECIENC